MSDEDIQRQIWEQRCPTLLAERDHLKDQLADKDALLQQRIAHLAEADANGLRLAEKNDELRGALAAAEQESGEVIIALTTEIERLRTRG